MSSDQLSALGVATIYEAAGRVGLIDTNLIQIIPDSRVAGPARTVLCGEHDNLGVHQALEQAQPGEILVIAMPHPEPVALVGDILALQAQARQLAGLLIDAAVRDHDELVALGLPIWARFIHATGADKNVDGQIGAPVTIAGQQICAGDHIVLDADGAVVIPGHQLDEVTAAAQRRADHEATLRPRIAAGELTLDLLDLRPAV